MKIKNAFYIPLSIEETWKTLLDIPAIAPSMPGAKLTASHGEDTYDGEVAVRLGPVLLSFKGQAQIIEKDDVAKTARVKAQGRDTKGRGSANAEVQFGLEEDGDRTKVDIITDLNLSGAVAQYGRGEGMITDLANHIIGEFATNLEKNLIASRTATQEHVLEPGTAVSPQAAETMPPPPAALSGFKLLRVMICGFFSRLFGRGSA